MATSSDALTLERLAYEPGLGLSVLVAGDLTRAVRGAHTIEIEQPSKWLEPEWVVLTTGLRFVGMPENTSSHESLIEELADMGAAALLFGVGVHFDTVPEGLVRAARLRGFPLLTVSAETPFHVVEDFVSHALLASDTQLMRTSLRLHQELLAALSSAEPVEALVSRLASLCRGGAILYDVTGHAVASAGDAPMRLIWEAVSTRSDTPNSFAVGRWYASTRPLWMSSSRFHLAIASHSEAVVAQLGDDMLTTGELVLTAADRIHLTAMSHERAEASRLVAQLRDGVPRSQAPQLWERMRVFNFVGEPELYVLVAAPTSGAWNVNARDFAHSLMKRAHRAHLGVAADLDLASERSDAPFVAVVADHPGLREWIDGLTTTFLVGLSGRFAALSDAPRFFEEAEAALDLCRRRAERDNSLRIIRFDDADLATWLLARRGIRAVAAKIDEQIAPLADAPVLRETVVTYLAASQDIGETARRLVVHPNTVRYRLERVAELLGERVSDARTVTNLYLAFQEEIVAYGR